MSESEPTETRFRLHDKVVRVLGMEPREHVPARQEVKVPVRPHTANIRRRVRIPQNLQS